MGSVLFLSAGRLDWYPGWTFIFLVVLVQVQVIATLQRICPDLLTERERIREGTKPWDKIIAPVIALVLPVLMWLTAGLDVRNAWTSPFPAWVQATGFVLAGVSSWLAARAMAANRFFSGTVRIQKERGHCVVSSGPYAIVRHPGCVGMLGFTYATPLALGSRLALLPAVACILLLLIRTVLEDRTLHAELAGYAAYAQRVRWRLIPGVW
jgi:protein-S-isoprenylcysteine O-methyltransferase Ste14